MFHLWGGECSLGLAAAKVGHGEGHADPAGKTSEHAHKSLRFDDLGFVTSCGSKSTVRVAF
jgi:hypothetical protein